jgi:hypothetical protein
MQFSFPQLSQNLSAKLEDGDFRADMTQLVANVYDDYTPDRAADLIIERLGSRLRNAPDQSSIRNGAWRVASSATS